MRSFLTTIKAGPARGTARGGDPYPAVLGRGRAATPATNALTQPVALCEEWTTAMIVTFPPVNMRAAVAGLLHSLRLRPHRQRARLAGRTHRYRAPPAPGRSAVTVTLAACSSAADTSTRQAPPAASGAPCAGTPRAH